MTKAVAPSLAPRLIYKVTRSLPAPSVSVRTNEVIVIADWTWVQLLTTVSGLYALGIAVFLIRDNRSPQSTFAWLFLMLVFPIGGVIIYTLFGRGWKAFSRKNQLHSLMEGTSLADRRTALLERQPGILEALSNDGTGEYGRLGQMLWASAGAPITLANQFQILQNASEIYPQLLNDMRAASKSIHLLFYEWAADAFTETVGKCWPRGSRQESMFASCTTPSAV